MRGGEEEGKQKETLKNEKIFYNSPWWVKIAILSGKTQEKPLLRIDNYIVEQIHF